MNKHKLKILIILSFIIVFIAGFTSVVIQSTGDADKYSSIKSIVPDKFKRYLKNNISYFKSKELEKQSIELKNDFIKINKKRVLLWRNLSENYMKDMNLYLDMLQSQNILSTDKTQYNLKKYKIPFFDLDYYEWEQKPIGYLEQTDTKVFFVTGNGVFFSYEKENINSKKISLNLIETNLKQIILDQNFFNIDRISVKDLLIKDEYIYLSYTREQKKNCYNTSIIRSKISDKFLIFKDFFVYEDCVPTSYPEWNAHQTGGTMYSSENMQEIIFSIGEFRDRKRAQDKKSIFGKIVKINVSNKNYKVISMGHRNVQGLFFDENNQVLIMSEHGPRGGDELNINHDINDKIENYGWPISSYGEHYNDKYPRLEAPLKKSHIKYGFVEPIKYWPISIGIGRVKKLPDNFNNKILKNSFFLGSMGWLPKQGHKTLYHLVFDENYKKIIKENKIIVNERIRDIDIDEKNKVIYLVLENSPSIAMLRFNNN